MIMLLQKKRVKNQNKQQQQISNYLLKCCLNNEYDKFREAVEKLINDNVNIYGDFILQDQERGVKASIFWFAVYCFNKNSPSLIKTLINRGKCNINAVGTCNQFIDATPLYVAIKLNHDKCVDLLVYRGANVNIPSNHSGITPIMAAADAQSDIYIAKKLLGTGLVNLNARTNDDDGYTALHYAIDGNKYKFASFLIKVGADPFIKSSKDEYDALMFFALRLGEDFNDDIYDDDDIDLSINYREEMLELFSNELMKKYEINLTIMYELLGASLKPLDLEWQKHLWNLSLSLNKNNKIMKEEEDKLFLDVVGTEKREFQTRKDIEKELYFTIDAVTQCIFVLQRILKPNDVFIKKRLKELLTIYLEECDKSESIKLLEYILEYNNRYNNEYKSIEENLKFITNLDFKVEYDFDFDYILKIVGDIFKKFMKIRQEMTSDKENFNVYNDIIIAISNVLYALYNCCDGRKDYLKQLRCFIKYQIVPANLKTLPLNQNSSKSVYDFYDIKTRNVKDFMDLVESLKG